MARVRCGGVEHDRWVFPGNRGTEEHSSSATSSNSARYVTPTHGVSEAASDDAAAITPY